MANILNVPPELIEHTVHDLGLADICNLRLSCLTIYRPSHWDEIIESGTREVAEQTRMNACTTTLESIKERLEALKAERDFILQSIADQAHVQATGIDISLLRIIFHNLKPVTLALSFEVNIQEEVYERFPARFCSDFPQLRERTSYAFITAMMAVAQSGLALSSLQVYGGEWGGALSLHDLHRALPRLKAEGITTALLSLQSLYICVALYLTKECNTEEENAQRNNTEWNSLNNKHHYMALAELISLAPNVEELNVEGFKVRRQRRGAYFKLDTIIQKALLHKLKKCMFREAYIKEDSLLHLLRNSPQLKSLHLKHIVLSSGSWKNIFDYVAPTSSTNSTSHETDDCSTASCKLDVVVLDRLSSSPNRSLLCFLQKDELGFLLDHRIEIYGADLCHGIQYEGSQGRLTGWDAALYRWRNDKTGVVRCGF
ncbi:hypothetical protein BDQ12DRAFT_759869 [Crucibulum laeve]|uniref:Uncharacterized protein n=1 Tax=Crucibulum laeve TaxID=68775 RepID=A0A5C3LRU6_9AGAR|nr:hypothetical protein BDQ12DRAFT_759869 [Crucibulum laeve]